jgi:hypothetical protein
MNQTVRLLQKVQTHENDLIFGRLEPTAIDHSFLPSLTKVEGKKRLRILVTHKYNDFPEQCGFVTDMSPLSIWNLAASIQYYHSDYDEYVEGMSGLQLIYLLCRFHECIPLDALAAHFDCTLDLYWNWERGLLNSDWKSSGNRMWKEEFLSADIKKEIERISKVSISDHASQSEQDYDKIPR